MEVLQGGKDTAENNDVKNIEVEVSARCDDCLSYKHQKSYTLSSPV